MLDALIDTLQLFPRGLVYVGLAVIILGIARVVQGVATPYSVREQLNTKDNVALALAVSGYYLGTIIIVLGAIYQPLRLIEDGGIGIDLQFGWDVLEVFITSLVGIAILNIARIVVDKLILYKFSTEKEIIEDQNVGTGAVEFGVYIAVSLIIAASITGAGGGPATSFAFLGLGLLVLIVFTLLYNLTTSFDIHEEIERDNVAVGVALGANIIAIGIVAFKAVFGDFVGWTEGLIAFAVFAIIGFIVLFVVRMLFNYVLHPSADVPHELAVDQNLGFAFLQGSVVISVSLILFFAI
ncbi:MAG: DUF350 domain-containing protein [Chloroflexi bacterium]|nr:DUF350 domain-containing protein [Chloroflexota bacterium]